MSQHDYVIANAPGATVRSDLNSLFAAMVSKNSGAAEPATTFAYQYWLDTTANLLKQRNGANTAWDVIDTSNAGHTVAKAAAFTAVGSDIATLFICTGTTYTIALTAAATLAGRWWAAILNNATGNLIVDPNAAETINGTATITIKPGGHAIVWCDGTNFHATGGHIDAISEGDVIDLAVAL